MSKPYEVQGAYYAISDQDQRIGNTEASANAFVEEKKVIQEEEGCKEARKEEIGGQLPFVGVPSSQHCETEKAHGRRRRPEQYAKVGDQSYISALTRYR